MDMETRALEDKVLDRRSTLRALFGLAAVAVGATAILAPAAAEAATPTPTPAPAAPVKDAEIGKDSELPKSDPTYYYRRRRVYYRPRRVYYRPRRVYYRRRYVRRVFW